MGWAELMRVTLMLALIVAMIFGLSAALRRTGAVRPQGPSVFRVLATFTLGNRERLYLLQVGNEQVVIGSSSGGLATLHTMKENIPFETAAPQAANAKFAEVIRMIGKGWTP